jgi:membrane AbrB-like protein
MKLHTMVPPVGGLLLGAAAGWVCSRIGTPIPWMMGPLVTIALLRVAGANVSAMPGGRQVGQWIIGTALGLYFTPAVVREVIGWWPLLAAGAVFAIALGYAAGVALAHMAAIDRTTAIFGSVPGGAAEMSVLGERFGARVDRVASAQSIRLIIVVTTVPTAFTLLGVHGADPYVPGATTFSAGGFALLMMATGVGSVLVSALRLPNAFVLGSLAVAIPLTAMQINLSTTPTLASNAGQCLLGCALGARFERDFFRGAPRFVLAVAVTVIGAILISALLGWIAAELAGLYPATVVLGMTPGGVAEMSITAKVLQLGVPLVTSFHVTRVVALLLCTAPVFARVRKWRQRRDHSRISR